MTTQPRATRKPMTTLRAIRSTFVCPVTRRTFTPKRRDVTILDDGSWWLACPHCGHGAVMGQHHEPREYVYGTN